MLMIHSILTWIASLFFALGALFGGHAQMTTALGAVTPVGSTQFTLAGAGVNSTQTTIPLASFTTPDGRPLTMAMFGTIGYGALEPQTTAKLEDVTFSGITQNTNGSATLTGVTRGNDFVTPYAASTTLAHSHAGGATFILTNTAGFYTQFASVNNAQTISGIWTYGSTSPPRYDADPIWANFSTQVLADVSYVNSVVASGAANASETVKGIIQLATGAQAALGTSAGSTGARLVVPNSLATSTPNAITPVGSFPTTAAIGGKLSQLWLNLTQAFSFSGGLTSTATTTLAGSNVNSNALVINTVPYSFPSSGVSSSTVWTFDANGKATYEPLPTAQFANGAVSIAANGGANAITTTFKPTIIRMTWSYPSGCSGTNGPQAFSGSGTWINGAYAESYNQNTGATGSACTPSSVVDNGSIVSGEAASNNGNFSGAISSVSSTGFTLTMTNATGATPTVKIAWEAEQ